MKDEKISNIIRITTPEGVSFPIRLASPVLRGIAFSLDFFCILTIQKCCSAVMGLVSTLSIDMAGALSIFSYFAISILYGVTLEWFWNGQTVGKRLFGLRVVDADGLKLQLSQIIVRNLLRMVDAMPGLYMVGGSASVISPCCQRFGDIAARTYVTREQKPREPDLSQLLHDKFNSFRKHPCAAAKARASIPPEVADLLLKVLLRRNSLKLECRTEIYRELVQYLKGMVKFPQEATDGLSNERYLRNMVDILYKR